MKRTIPLALIQTIEKTVAENRHLIKFIEEDNSLLYLKDANKESDFYFRIKAIDNKKAGGNNDFIVEKKPFSARQVEPKGILAKYDSLENLLKQWIELLKEYNKVGSIFEDLILESYQNQVEDKFQILDEDAHVAPFDLNRQLWLEEYLDKVIETVEKRKDETNVNEVEEIIEESRQLQKELSQSTKSQVIKKLSRILAKGWKLSLDIVKELIIDVSAEVIKKSLMG